MVVGFIITDFKGHEEDAVSFIQDACILDSLEIAKNIVRLGVGVNIYTSALDIAKLASQPFESSLIVAPEGTAMIASAVNFRLELPHNGEIIKLFPTENFLTYLHERNFFSTYEKQNLVRIFPKVWNPQWLLFDGHWHDGEAWLDNKLWDDGVGYAEDMWLLLYGYWGDKGSFVDENVWTDAA